MACSSTKDHWSTKANLIYPTGDNLSSADGHIIGGENWTRHDMSGCKDWTFTDYKAYDEYSNKPWLHTQSREHKPLISDGTSLPPPSFWTSPSRHPTPRPPLPSSRAAFPLRSRHGQSSPLPPSGTLRLLILPYPRFHLVWCHRVSRLNNTVNFTGKQKILNIG